MFKQKPEDWTQTEEKHKLAIESFIESQEKSAIFTTTTFYIMLPHDLKIYIYPFITFQDTMKKFLTMNIEMFKVIGNYLYTPDLNRVKKAQFIIAPQS